MIKLQNLKRKLCLLLLSFCMAGVLVAQNSNEQQKLQGKWVLVDVTAIIEDGGDSISLDAKDIKKNPKIIAPDLLEISNNSLKTVRGEIDSFLNTKIKEINQNTSSVSSLLNFNIEEEEGVLYLKYNYNPEVSQCSIYYISLIYKSIVE